MVGEGGERGEEIGIAALGELAHDGAEQLFLVAVVVVDGLPRHAGLRGDQVDVGAAKPFAAEHRGGRFENRQSFRNMAARQDQAMSGAARCQSHKN